VLGQVGHALWNGKGIRLINFLHIIIGVTILPLAVWNMGMGFDLWLWVPPKAASYVVSFDLRSSFCHRIQLAHSSLLFFSSTHGWASLV
jgi:hypothetical protein